MRLTSYLQSAQTILSLYDGGIPFSAWLKNYFRQHKKFGSKDRKLISDLCFCFFRLGEAFAEKTVEERLLIAQALCHIDSAFVKELKPEWKDEMNRSIEEKLRFLNADAKAIFPFAEEVSNEIEKQAFIHSHLIQPDLFLRIRRKKRNEVVQKLTDAGIEFLEEGLCIRLPNASKIDEVIGLDKEAVVQDKSSQQVLQPLQNYWQKENFTNWDCCAASGGKSILLHDLFPQAQLTVSDIRDSILHNLRSRFKRAGIQGYQSFVADVSSPHFASPRSYDVIICDAPCTGSGTWGRTPEQLRFFLKERINHYAALQKSIALNASKSLKPGGAFVYITCSVFSAENEEVVAYLQQQSSLKLISQQYIEGYRQKADTLFTALFSL